MKIFEFFFKSNSAFRVTFNTLFMNTLFIIIGTIAAVGLAIILNELKNRLFAKVSNTFMFLPHFISWVIVAYFVYAFLNVDYGLVNKILAIVRDSLD